MKMHIPFNFSVTRDWEIKSHAFEADAIEPHSFIVSVFVITYMYTYYIYVVNSLKVHSWGNVKYVTLVNFWLESNVIQGLN